MPGTVLNILHIIHAILIELATVIMDTWNKRRGLNPSWADGGDLRRPKLLGRDLPRITR